MEAKEITTDDIKAQLKPLSTNPVLSFFQRLWRGWLTGWYRFANAHPKMAKLLYMLTFFLIFSNGVTIWQFIVMTFMPYFFGDLNYQAFVWPAIELKGVFDAEGNQMYYAIFNEPAAANGGFGGLGNFIAFEIAVFTAQCINFPLQRNITFKSHGNVLWQAMWYFIGWVLISIFVNALWGIMNPFLLSWQWSYIAIGVVKTVVTGGLSMVIFFWIFLIIFPDLSAAAKRAGKKLERMKSSGQPQEKIDELEQVYISLSRQAEQAEAEKAEAKAIVQANAKAISYIAVANNSKLVDYDVKLKKAFDEAAEAIKAKQVITEKRRSLL